MTKMQWIVTYVSVHELEDYLNTKTQGHELHSIIPYGTEGLIVTVISLKWDM
jgi:hypothetical protein